MIAFLALIDSEENKTKFSHLYNKYCRLIYTIAYEKLSSREAAEDTVQDTFLYIAKRMDALDFSDEGRTKNYLATVARNLRFDFADDCNTAVFRSADFGRSDNTKHGRYLYIP